MAHMIFDPKQCVSQRAKPLPIILLLDTSGSMNIVTNPDEVTRTGRTDVIDGNIVEYVDGGITRISVLNNSVRKMLKTLSKYERESTEFLVSIITFGLDTRLVLPPSQVARIHFDDLKADGNTPLGKALDIAKDLIDDRARIPSRSYRPLVILVSDGEPDDGWKVKFDNFITQGRSAKCDRMALAIGDEANRKMLMDFIDGTGHSLFEADTAEEITNFFKFVTMSTVQRTLSRNPDEIPTDANVYTSHSQSLSGYENETDSTKRSQADEEESYW